MRRLAALLLIGALGCTSTHHVPRGTGSSSPLRLSYAYLADQQNLVVVRAGVPHRYELTIPDVFEVKASPDGKWIALASSKSGLRVAPIAIPLAFKQVSEHTVDSFFRWSDDSRAIAFASTRIVGGKVLNTFVVAHPRDEFEQTVGSFKTLSDGEIVPLGFDDGKDFFFSHEGEGGTFDLSALDVRSHKIKVLIPGLIDQRGTPISPTGDAYFDVSRRAVVRVNTRTKRETVVYRLAADETSIDGLRLSGDGGQLLFIIGTKQGQSFGRVVLSTGEIRRVSAKGIPLNIDGWSPDHRYLWLDDSTNGYLFDLETARLTTVATAEQRLDFVGWL